MDFNFEFHLLYNSSPLPASSSSDPSLRLDVWTLNDPATSAQDTWNLDKRRSQTRSDQGQSDDDATVPEITVVRAENLLENVTPEVLAASREIRALSQTLGSSVQTLFCMFLNYTNTVKVPVMVDNFIFYLKNWAGQDLKAEASNAKDGEQKDSDSEANDEQEEKIEAIIIYAKKKTLLKRKLRNERKLRNKEVKEENQVKSPHTSKPTEHGIRKICLTPKARKSIPICHLTSRQLWKLAIKNNIVKRKGIELQTSDETKKVVDTTKFWKCQPVVKKVTCVQRNGTILYDIEKSTRRCTEDRLSLHELLKMKIEARLVYETTLDHGA